MTDTRAPSLRDLLLKAAHEAALRASSGDNESAVAAHHLTLALAAAPPHDPPAEAQDAEIGAWVGRAREVVAAHEWKLRELRDRFQNGGTSTSARIASEIDTHLEEHKIPDAARDRR